MTRHCHHCGEEWTLTSQPGRGESCFKCRAEPVLEKHAGNFCEYFEFVRRTWTPKAEQPARSRRARAVEKIVWRLMRAAG
jgi:hypothetical protein